MYGKIKVVVERVIRKCELLKYNIAFVDNDYSEIISGEKLSYHLLKHNDRNWYADPFVLDVTENYIILLVEEYNYQRWRGQITKLTVDKRNYRLLNKQTILELDTHLSYPAIIRKNDDIIVYPENGASGMLYAYQYDDIKQKLINKKQILDIAVADATITDLFGDRYLFCTKQEVCSGNELTIFKEVNSEWVEFQTVYSNENIARMAGDFFCIDDVVYRPAQDCNKSYGNGTVIQKVEFKDGKFSFTSISRYFSPNKRLNHGIHTLNSYKGVTVVDMEGYEWPILAKIATILRYFV